MVGMGEGQNSYHTKTESNNRSTSLCVKMLCSWMLLKNMNIRSHIGGCCSSTAGTCSAGRTSSRKIFRNGRPRACLCRHMAALLLRCRCLGDVIPGSSSRQHRRKVAACPRRAEGNGGGGTKLGIGTEGGLQRILRQRSTGNVGLSLPFG